MRAIVIDRFGAEDVLGVADIPEPEPGPGEALVRVEAVEVSRTRDVATRTGLHPFSSQVALPHVLGGDFAGVVEAVGSGLDPGLVGKHVAVACLLRCGCCKACRARAEMPCEDARILGVHRQGSYAERVAVPAANVQVVPADVPMSQVVALAATGPIALTQLLLGEVSERSSLLVVGAGGSLGTTLLALTRHLGKRAFALSRRPEALPAALEPAGSLSSDSPDLAAELREVTDGAAIEVVIDNVAVADVFDRYFDALRAGARVVVSGAVEAGRPGSVLPVPAARLYLGSISILGVRGPSRDGYLRFWSEVESGFRLPSELIEELPMSAAADAHRIVASGSRMGHTVLTASW
jgi:NADPH:quinone reductase-like Zn-dependent oxidoreductase